MNRKIFTSFMLIGILAFGTVTSAYAGETSADALQPYEDKLEELSSELGTELAIVPSEDGTMDDAVDFYTDMSMEEFENYVKNAYEEAEALDYVTDEYAVEEFVTEESENSDISLLSANVAYYQKFFYSSGNTNNYLYVRAFVNNETSLYTGSVYDMGSVQKTYPSYKYNSGSYSFSSNKKKITCKYNVTKYLSSNLIETTVKTITCTYTANGGHLYASGSV